MSAAIWPGSAHAAGATSPFTGQAGSNAGGAPVQAAAPIVAGPPGPPPPPGPALPPGAPGSDLPAPPRQARGSYLHDGFYLRMGLGLSYGGALVSSDSKGVGDYNFGGAGVAFDLWLGGTPTPGLELGRAVCH